MAKTKTSKAVKQPEVADVVEEEVKQTKKVANKTSKATKPEVVEEELLEEEDQAEESSGEKKKRSLPTRDSVIASFDELIESVEKEIEVLRDKK